MSDLAEKNLRVHSGFLVTPEGWSETTVSQVCELGRGRVISQEEINSKPGPYPVFSSQTRNNGQMGSIDTFDFSGDYVTWTTDGENAGTVFFRSGQFNCTNVCGTLRARSSSELDLSFFTYHLGRVAKNYVSYIGNPKLMNGVMASIGLILPPGPQQRRIATILTTLDEVIEATEKLVEKHQQIKAGLMHDLFTRGLWTRPELARGDHKGTPAEATAQEGQLRPTPEEAPGLYQDSPLGLIPKAWEAANLLSISNSMTNGFVGTATPYYSEDEDAVQYLYGNNVRADKLELPSSMRVTRRFHELQRKSQLQPGDMLTVQSGHIGTSAIVPESLGEANCHALIITKFKTSRVVPAFVSYYCNSPGGYQRLGSIFVGSTILHINVKEFKNFAIPLPQDLREQESICDRLVVINERIDTENTHLAKLRQQKQGLMHDLLTGRVRVDGERGFDSQS